MHRFLFFALLLLTAGAGRPATGAPSGELPARPVPFRFVTDQARLLSAAEAQSLENGLRRYADANGTQMVVVTVPTLDGRPVADYARALGQSWGVGQRGKDNGLVLLVAAQEHQVSIQAGQGLRTAVTPELTSRIIREQLTPLFKQGRYFAGLRAGLNQLLAATDPKQQMNPAAAAPDAGAAAGQVAAAATTTAPGLDATAAAAAPATTDASAPAAEPAPASEPFRPSAPVAEPESAGPGWGMLALGALLIGGVLWLVSRLFRRRAAAPAPDFLPGPPASPNRPGPGAGYSQRPGQPAPDFLPNRGGSSGSGMGGILMTGAAAAAGAYLGNRMAHGQDESDAGQHNQPLDDAGSSALAGPAAGTAGAASGSFPALDDSGAAHEPTPDYFADDAGSAAPDYFSSDDTSSYDDSSSDDTGGGGFDDDDSNSGSW